MKILVLKLFAHKHSQRAIGAALMWSVHHAAHLVPHIGSHLISHVIIEFVGRLFGGLE